MGTVTNTDGDAVRANETAHIRALAAEAAGLGLSRTAFFLATAENFTLEIAVRAFAERTKEIVPPSPFVYTMS